MEVNMSKKAEIPKQEMPAGIPKEWLEELGINEETGIAYHYVNDLANVLFPLDIIIGEEWSSSQKYTARKTLPQRLKRMPTYKQFLLDQADQYNQKTEDYIDPYVIEKIMQSGSRAQMLEEVILKMKYLSFLDELVPLETLKDLLVEVSYLLAGDKGELAMKKRLKIE